MDAPLLLFAQTADRSEVAERYGPPFRAVETLRRSESTLDEPPEPRSPMVFPLPGSDQPDGTPEVAAAPARMLREGVQLIEAIAAQRTLVIVLEDGHRCRLRNDRPLPRSVRRRSAARILVLDIPSRGRGSGKASIVSLCAELELKRLATNVAMALFGIVTQRPCSSPVSGTSPSATESFAALLVSGGNPLFITALVDYLVSSGRHRIPRRGT